MSNVVQLKPSMNAADALRDIANRIESGELENEVTVICGTEVFHAGVFDDGVAATNAVWNMTYGIHKLMNRAIEE